MSTEVRASIIAGNIGGDTGFSSGTVNPFVSRGDNLIGSGNATGAFNQAGDQINVTAPGLGPLANNGGPTSTHALITNSPAIDAVTGTCPTTSDQRGVSRPQDGDAIPGALCDIGSFELEPAALLCNGLTPTIIGTPSGGTITGTNGSDVILGLDGNDVINGGNGDDVICGGDGNDILNGGNGNDQLFGDGGDDTLNGDRGNDTLNG